MSARTPYQLARDLLNLVEEVVYAVPAGSEKSLDLDRATSAILEGQVVNWRDFKRSKAEVGRKAFEEKVQEINSGLARLGRRTYQLTAGC